MNGTVLLWPYPPSKNRLYRVNHKTGQFYHAAVWKDWRIEVDRFMRAQPEPNPISGETKVHVLVDQENTRVHDCQNFTDAVCDMLEEIGVIENDKQISDYRIRWDRDGHVANGLMVFIDPIKARAA